MEMRISGGERVSRSMLFTAHSQGRRDGDGG